MPAHAVIDLPLILSILRAIAGQLDFRSVIRAVSNEISAILPHDHLDIALLSGDRMGVVAYETGLHTEWDASETLMKPVESSPIRDLFSGKVDFIVTDDAQIDPRFHFPGAFSRPIFDAGLHARLHVPLKIEGRVIGCLSLSAQVAGCFQVADVGNAQIVADILASYIYSLQQGIALRESERQQIEAEARAEGLRTGALHLTEELENARQAIGMDLHDQTLADLSRIARNLERVQSQHPVRVSDLRVIQDDVGHCLQELRIIIDNAKPTVLELFGFGQALEALLDRSVHAGRQRLDYRFRDDGASAIDALPSRTQVTLFRIVQEAVNNAVRHSGAAMIDVTIDRVGSALRIVVEDDGSGFSLGPGQWRGGVRNMHTRASLIKAALDLRTGAGGRGTRWEIRLPEDAADHA